MNKYTECYVAETEDTASVDALAFSYMESTRETSLSQRD